MFAYNPSVNDRSGEFIAQGMTNAASINAQSMQQMGKDIGGAITSIAGIYAQGKAQAAEGKAFKEFMGVAGKKLGFTNEDLDFFKNMPDQDAYQMSSISAPILPSMFNSLLTQQRYGNQMALGRQTAANQAALRQTPPNQIPMNATGTSAGKSPVYFGNINTNPQ